MRKQILGFVEEAMKDHLPGVMADSLERAAQSFSKDGQELVASVLTVVADAVHEHGTEGAEAIMDEVRGMLDDSDPLAVHKLNQRGVYLSDVVDALQSAEAKEKEDASEAVRVFVAVATEVAEKVIKAGIVALI